MQDYASRLRSLPGVDTASQTIGPRSAQALMGPYAGSLPGVGEGTDGNGSGYQLQLADNAPVTPEQRGIIDMMMSAFNNSARVR